MNEKYLAIIKRSEVSQTELFYKKKSPPSECIDDLFKILKSAIDKREPFSFVRLGDGEGRILGYPDTFEKEVYINQVLSYQFGKESIVELKKNHGENYLEEGMSTLKSLVQRAIINADVIGAPSFVHFKKELSEQNITPRTAQAICLNYLNEEIIPHNKKIIFDHFIFKPFNKKGYFKKLLSNLNELTIISHSNQSQQIKEAFNINNVNHIKIPGHQTFIKSNEVHYPTYYHTVLNEIKNNADGKVFFVAAGYLGKHYCDYIKSNGGIAIDIGSIFDSWFGQGRKDAIQDKSHLII